MASAKQIAANRRNAARSTGPRTLSGKKRASMNAIRHGLGVVGTPETSLDLDSLFDRMTRIESERASLFQQIEEFAKKRGGEQGGSNATAHVGAGALRATVRLHSA
jgi:hypothetical protein